MQRYRLNYKLMYFWKFQNHEQPLLIFNRGKVNYVNRSKDQEKLKHENIQLSK